jgi:hypothetical protein
MTLVGLFFGVVGFEFVFVFAETSVYENLITIHILQLGLFLNSKFFPTIIGI